MPPVAFNCLGDLHVLLLVVVSRVAGVLSGHVASELSSIAEFLPTEQTNVMVSLLFGHALGNDLFELINLSTEVQIA